MWPQHQIGLMVGAPSSASCPLCIVSLVAGDALVECEGRSYQVPMQAIGTDRGAGPAQAGYHGSVMLTGLPHAATRYPFTVRQGGNSRSGVVTTAPSESDDFRLYFAGCDNNGGYGGVAGGYYGHMAAFLDQGGIAYALHVDDLFGYVDGNNAMLIDDSAGTGHSVTGEAASTVKEYDYALNYLCGFGLLEDMTQRPIRWGRNPQRLRCLAEMPWLVQVGDHEFENDCRWDVGSDAVGQYALGRQVWDKLMGPLMPALIAPPTTAWAHTLGCLRVAAYDRVTNASSDYAGSGIDQFAQILGDAQIDAILEALDTDHAFKLLGCSLGDRYFEAAATAAEFMSGQQNTLGNHCPAEYQRLHTRTGAAPNSLMDNPRTNGTTGQFLAFHGDTHHAGVYEMAKAAYAGNAAESWWSWFLGTINGSVNFGLTANALANCVDGGSYDGMNVIYTQDSGDPTHARHRWHGLYADVYGSRSPKELHVVLADETNRTKVRAIYRLGENGNLPSMSAGLQMA